MPETTYGWTPHVSRALLVCTTDPVRRPCTKGGFAIRAPQNGVFKFPSSFDPSHRLPTLLGRAQSSFTYLARRR